MPLDGSSFLGRGLAVNARVETRLSDGEPGTSSLPLNFVSALLPSGSFIATN